MPYQTLDFTTALVTGGGGGIGRAMSEYFISIGKKVIIVGRTESTLQQTAKEIGATAYYTLDTGDLKAIPDFVKKVTKEHPDLDCLVNNAGVQRPLDINNMSPEEFTQKADQEIAINIQGPMHLIMHLLPHFKSKSAGATIINVSSVLGYLPSSIINPVYNGTKAWVHFWTLNLRTQLQQAGHQNVRVVEVAPPTVATNLHRERADPDDNKKEKNSAAMSLEEFMRDVVEQLREGKETFGAGPGKKAVEKWFEAFGGDYEKAAGGGR